MKIIKRGEIPEPKTYRSVCVNCKTVFEFTQVEAHCHGDQRDGDYLAIACPVCNKHAYVKP